MMCNHCGMIEVVQQIGNRQYCNSCIIGMVKWFDLLVPPQYGVNQRFILLQMHLQTRRLFDGSVSDGGLPEPIADECQVSTVGKADVQFGGSPNRPVQYKFQVVAHVGYDHREDENDG